MSSGSQIGGVVGGVVGGIVGFYTGNVAQGVQWGYAIGSAVGGYVDPARSYGPRLEDATAQTSTVGGIIPFGYGTFTCMGNIIWCDDLIEHRKTERVGKGGGEKQTTYTYTRSYAIGVCEGAISRYMWIKKNGKLVYAADPAALGAAMGWDGAQIGDLAAASNEFLQIATLYRGTADQMPDPVIEAVEGVGNVAPNRDLAYIVLENEDLTDMQGAVSQYEFCVQAEGVAYATSPPYVVEVVEDLVSAGRYDKWEMLVWEPQPMQSSVQFVSAELRSVMQIYDNEPQPMQSSVQFVSAELREQLRQITNEPQPMASNAAYSGASLVEQMILYTNEPQPMTSNATYVGGELS